MQARSSLMSMLALVLGAALFPGPLGVAAAAEKSEYRIGDRLPQKPAVAVAGYKEVTWEALTPPDWDPARELKDLDLSKLSDSDPRAIKALEKLRAAMDNAPVVSALNGARIRIAGFLVPLDAARGQVSEFLLVPYFGACIHVPPPPANQIIHVAPTQPFKTSGAMEAVWVSGVLETTRSDTVMGNAGYRMKADLVTLYRR